jgi:hypothetical protein
MVFGKASAAIMILNMPGACVQKLCTFGLRQNGETNKHQLIAVLLRRQ